MTYASICSGIEAATVAWHPLGWRPAWFAEIDRFPSAVLAHHYPQVPNCGDFTAIRESEPIDLLVGGTPCQSFSVAGRRAGLDDPRGCLTMEWLALAAKLRPRWLVWENVPGVLSDDAGRTFGTVLGTLGQLGYGFAYRVLDAQYFGVPQRRRRVFVVGHLGDWRRAAAVLFERHSLQGHPPPSPKARADVAATLGQGASSGGGRTTDIEQTLAVTSFSCKDHGQDAADIAPTLRSMTNNKQGRLNGGGQAAVAFNLRGREGGSQPEIDKLASVRASGGGSSRSYVAGSAVRRLTPRECERLQGFPDDWTLIPYRGKPAADSPRYKAIGNSMAVPVMRWIGERLAAVDAIP